MMIMETERLLLRRWQIDDAQALYNLACDPEVGPAAGWQPHRNIEESRYIIENVLSGPQAYAIYLKNGKRIIGAIELMLQEHSNVCNSSHECELGYWLGKAYWGKGLMTEAVQEILRHAFEDLGMSKVWCKYYQGNDRSRRVQEKAGFKYLRSDKDVAVPRLNERRTSHVNVLCKEEWLRNK